MGLIRLVKSKYFDLSYKDRSRLTSKGSILYNLSSGIIKLVFGLIFSSIFLVIGGFYSIGLSLIRMVFLVGTKKDPKKEMDYFYIMTIILTITCFIYLYNAIRFFDGNNDYQLLVGLAIVIYGVIDLTIAIVGLLKTNKENDLLLTGVKWVCLTSAITSIAMTQAAALALVSEFITKDLTIYIGVGTLFFGFLNILICFKMFSIHNDPITRRLVVGFN